MTPQIRYVPTTYEFKGNNYPTCSPSDFLTRLENKMPTYEVLPNDDKHIKFNLDFDYYVAKEEFNIATANDIQRLLKDRINNTLTAVAKVTPTIHILSSHSNNALKADGSYTGKYSIRFFISNIIASRDSIKDFVIDMNEYFDKQETELWDYIEKPPDNKTFDTSIYNKEKKMRCYETSKPEENRPLKLEEGTIEGTIITSFFDKDAFVFNYEGKKRPTSPTSIVSCNNIQPIKNNNKYLELLDIIGAGNKKIMHPTWFQIGSILKTNGYSKEIFEQFTNNYVSNKNNELDKTWDCIHNDKVFSIFGLQKIAKVINLGDYNEWFIRHKQYIPVKIIIKGNNDIAEFVSKGLKEILVYCNKSWIMYDNRINLWRITDAPNAQVCKYIQYLIDCSLETIMYKMNRVESEDDKTKMKTIQDLYFTCRIQMADNKQNSMILKFLKDYLNDNEFEEKLDVNKYIVAYKNGIFDLKSGIFKEGLSASDMLTKTIPYNYEDAKQEDINKVRYELLKICNNNEIHLEYYLSALGYAMTGDSTKLQEFYYIIGQKASNGKSVIFEALSQIIPCYCKNLEKDTFDINNKNSHKEIATWKGCRIGWINELNQNKQDAEMIKQVCDGTSIKYKAMYGISVTIPVTLKLFIASNHSPTIDADAGIKRRLQMFQMDSEFIEGLETEDFEKCMFKRDSNFGSTLVEKYKFALMDLIYSYSKKFFNNNYKLSQYPPEWNIVKNECLADNNPFVEFIMEHFEFGESHSISEYALKQYFKCNKISEKIRFTDEVKKNKWNLKRGQDKKWNGFKIKEKTFENENENI